LDAETGEMVSKGELKRRQKLRQKEGKKAEKLAANPLPVKASTEEVLDPLKYFENRCAQVEKMRAAGTAYPHKVF
jgi:lysyl-tRNA synthetase, class II